MPLGMTKQHLRLLAAAALPFALVACDLPRPGLACNAMYSPDQVLIDFGSFEFEPGAWSLQIDAEEVITCDFDLPADDLILNCDGAEVYGTLSNDGLHIDELNVWEFAPADFSVSLSLDGELVAEQDFSPEYDEDEPNGEGCGVRQFASVAFEPS